VPQSAQKAAVPGLSDLHLGHCFDIAVPLYSQSQSAKEYQGNSVGVNEIRGVQHFVFLLV
jgi:hypothetical protein